MEVSPRVKELIAECVADLVEHKVPISLSVEFRACKGATRNGYCSIRLKPTPNKNRAKYCIYINQDLLEERDIKSVIVHELLHTIDNQGATAHRGEWRRWADYVNCNMGYSITVSANYKRSTRVKRNRKFFEEYEYDPSTMEIIECPVCHKKFYIKSGMERDQYGASKYWCRRCDKKLYYTLPYSLVKDVDMSSQTKWVEDVINARIPLKKELIVTALAYLPRQLCDRLFVGLVTHYPSYFLDNKRKIECGFAIDLQMHASKKAKCTLADMYLNGTIARLNNMTYSEYVSFSDLLIGTAKYKEVTEHYHR